MRVEVLDEHPQPEPWQTVTVKKMGNITEVRYMAVNRRGCAITKVNKDRYIVLSTGEVKDFVHHEKRIDDTDSIKQSIKRLREVINCNVTNPLYAKWVTLTYADNMQSSVKLYADFKAFNARLRYWLKTNKKPLYEYIAVAEPQQRGAWHFHCFLIFPGPAPYIHFSIIREAWRQGAIDIKALDTIDNVGAYLTPYLTDIAIDEGLSGKAPAGLRVVEETGKAYIKGGRLRYYPAGMRLYRASRGIKRPIVFKCSAYKSMQYVGSAKLTYEKTIKLCEDDTGKTINVINYRQFNKSKKGD